MNEPFGPLVDCEWVHAHLRDPAVVMLDCRWRLQDPHYGEASYRESHIPGAVLVDMARDLSGPAEPGAGRHPLPDAQAFAQTMSKAGVGTDTWVVCYDDDAAGAARCWWLLRFFGHARSAVLNGGFPSWQAAGLPTEDHTVRPHPRQFVPIPDLAMTVDFETLLPNRQVLTLVDARSAERFRGKNDPVDRIGGHIPGAVNVPYTEVLDSAGHFKAPEAQKRLFAPVLAKTRQPVVYCGSGVTACVDILALTLAEVEPRLYPGSWSGWIEHPAAPIARD